jgi:2-polyprenyl-3-methyl-5-hydroxy-6-metoxy-1,4-benzoquinol methylase
LVPIQILYSQGHSAGTSGDIWINHHKAFARFILEDSPKSICEIGAGHLTLSEMIIEKNPNIRYLIIEPNQLKAPHGVKTIKGFIEDNFPRISNYQAIVHSHVLEHVYNPRLFISGIATNMSMNSAMYISFPNIEKLISTQGLNSLNFEHTYYLDPNQLKSLLEIFGLQVVQESRYLDHSYFFKVIKIGYVSNSKILSIHHTAEPFKKMWQELAYFVHSTNSIISKDLTPNYLFGAHIFSQGLIALGLNTRNIEGILDNAINKQGKRLYGSNLEVFSFEAIRNLRSVRVILKASHYQNEIKKQLFSINRRTEIIE